MPECAKCGEEKPMLYSFYTTLPDKKGKPTTSSYALCDKCLKEAENKEVRRVRS